MPLDGLQKAVLHVLLQNRSPQSVFAGGSVLHRHAYRLSDDQDIFHAEHVDILEFAARDIDALAVAGFAVERTKEREGFCEAIVGSETMGRTKIQWVQAGSWSFFAPVPDPEYGWRLHMADLAINKVLAAGGRREVRDYVDLAMIHRHIMPLWAALWAAPGKDDSWTPLSLIERIAMQNNFRQEDIDEEILSTIPLSASEVGHTVRSALDEARTTLPRLRPETAGCLFVDPRGHPITDAETILAAGDDVQPIQPHRGGTWPSGPDVDHAMILHFIETFGYEGQIR